MITTDDLDLLAWLGSQKHRGDAIGDLARQLARGAVDVTNLPPALRPTLSSARSEFRAAGEVLAGDELRERLTEIRHAARLPAGVPA
jgi:hypothetical protein